MPLEKRWVEPSGITTGPDYEIAATAARWGKSTSEFRSLPGEQQSEMVAFYRVEQRIQAVLADEANKKPVAKE